MAYETLKSDIQGYVRQNGEGAITGDGLQSILLEIVNTLGTGYKYVGVATPSTSPGTPTETVFYIGGAGTYANFGTTVNVAQGQIAVFKYNNGWSADTLITVVGEGGVSTSMIAASAVTNAKINDGAVGTSKLGANAVTTAKIADNAVETAKIKDSNVTTSKIADSNVTTAKIADGNVTTAKISDSNVTTAKIADANVTTAKVADGAITTAKVADENITTGKIADEAVTTAKIADDAVTTDKVADGAITDDKLQNPVSVSQNSETGKTELLIGDTPALIVDNEPEVGSDNLVKSGGTCLQTRENTNNVQLCLLGKFVLKGELLLGNTVLTRGLTLKNGVTYTFKGAVTVARSVNDYLYIFDENGNALHYDVIVAANQYDRTITWSPNQDYNNVFLRWNNNNPLISTDYSLEVSQNSNNSIEYITNYINSHFNAPLLDVSWQMMGIATPDTSSPNITTGKLYYLAMTEGVYTNLGNLRLVKGEVALLLCNNGVWSKIKTSIINSDMREDGAVLASLGYVTNNYSLPFSGSILFKNLSLKAGKTYTLKGEVADAISTYNSHFSVRDKNGDNIISAQVFIAQNQTDATRTFTVQRDYEGAYIFLHYNTPLISNYLSTELRESSATPPEGIRLEIAIPDIVYATEDVELNLYNDAISFAITKGLYSPINYVVNWLCDKGTITDRCFRFTPSAADVNKTYNCTCTIYNIEGAIVATKTFTIKVKAKNAVSGTKRIVFFGDSLGANTASALNGDFNNSNMYAGTIPTMLGTRSVGNLHFEAVGGYRWMDYATSGRYAYRLNVTGVTSIGLGATYSITINDTTTNLLVREVNITEGTGNILVESQYGWAIANFPSTGTLTLVSGAGDASINFTNGHRESGNPLWNNETSQLDVALYRERLGLSTNEKIDAVAFQLGLNDGYDADTIIGYIDDLYDAFIADNPNCKFIVGMPPISGNDFNGSGANYGAGGNPIGQNIKMYNFLKLYSSLPSASRPNLIVSTAGLGVDRWYGYGFSTRQVSARNSTTEEYHNNYVHPITSGYNQLGDGYLAPFIEALS